MATWIFQSTKKTEALSEHGMGGQFTRMGKTPMNYECPLLTPGGLSGRMRTELMIWYLNKQPER